MNETKMHRGARIVGTISAVLGLAALIAAVVHHNITTTLALSVAYVTGSVSGIIMGMFALHHLPRPYLIDSLKGGIIRYSLLIGLFLIGSIWLDATYDLLEAAVTGLCAYVMADFLLYFRWTPWANIPKHTRQLIAEA